MTETDGEEERLKDSAADDLGDQMLHVSRSQLDRRLGVGKKRRNGWRDGFGHLRGHAVDMLAEVLESEIRNLFVQVMKGVVANAMTC